ncbi:MAG: DMT family transporter [Propionibacteriaceae bacterium]|nr:DMT family transporter [Propionibacteriaceae bacterium]
MAVLVAAIGITAAFVFGCADFLGGLAAQRSHAVLVTGVSALTGLVLLLASWPLTGGALSWQAMAWGAASGVSGALALALLYACLAVGPMSILSPLTAIVSAVVPMTVGLARGEGLSPLGYLGLGLALVAVVMVGFVPERGAVRPSGRALAMAVGSGAMIGLFLVLIEQAPHDSGMIPLLFNRGVNALLMVATLVWLRLGRRSNRPLATNGLWIAAVAGVVDAFANALLLLGVRLGDLSVMGVLTALYPAGTIVLAAGVLKERIAPVQWVGLAIALAATALLSFS